MRQNQNTNVVVFKLFNGPSIIIIILLIIYNEKEGLKILIYIGNWTLLISSTKISRLRNIRSSFTYSFFNSLMNSIGVKGKKWGEERAY